MITEIKLKLGDKEIVLNQEEAMELRNDLNQLLGPQFPIYPFYPYYQQPVIQPYLDPGPFWETGTCEEVWTDNCTLDPPGLTIGPGYDHPAWVTNRIGYDHD